jgi:hypothetical protein
VDDADVAILGELIDLLQGSFDQAFVGGDEIPYRRLLTKRTG